MVAAVKCLGKKTHLPTEVFVLFAQIKFELIH